MALDEARTWGITGILISLMGIIIALLIIWRQKIWIKNDKKKEYMVSEITTYYKEHDQEMPFFLEGADYLQKNINKIKDEYYRILIKKCLNCWLIHLSKISYKGESYLMVGKPKNDTANHPKIYLSDKRIYNNPDSRIPYYWWNGGFNDFFWQYYELNNKSRISIGFELGEWKLKIGMFWPGEPSPMEQDDYDVSKIKFIFEPFLNPNGISSPSMRSLQIDNIRNKNQNLQTLIPDLKELLIRELGSKERFDEIDKFYKNKN